MEALPVPVEKLNLLNTLFTKVWQSYLKDKITYLTADEQREINLNVLKVEAAYQEADDTYQLEFYQDGLTFANEKMKIEFDGKEISKLILIDSDKDA